MAVTTPHFKFTGIAVCILAFFSQILFSQPTLAADRIGEYVVPSSRAAQVKQCVEPADHMRRYHMELIQHQRDATVRHGIRSTKYSLSNCISCHTGHTATGEPIAINASGQFCNACHAAAAVTLNCFDCHATIPSGEGWNHEVAQQQRLLPPVSEGAE